MSNRITARPAGSPPPSASPTPTPTPAPAEPKAIARAAAPKHEDLFAGLKDKLLHGAEKLLGKVEQAAWQVEEDLQSRLSGQPNAEQIYVHHGLWAQKVSGGQTDGVDLAQSQAALNGMLGQIPSALAHNPELGRTASFDVVGGADGTLKLNATSAKAVAGLQAPFDKMFSATVDTLGQLRDGKLSPSDYMVQVMSNASRISSDWAAAKHLPASARNEAFARLVHFAFCAHRDDDSGQKQDSTDLKREALGFGISDAGSLLEDAYRMTVAQRFSTPGADPSHPSVFGNGVGGGFNFNVQDRQSGGSTITHHFGEFLSAGFVDLLGQADPAVTHVDSPKANPADVRNGYFAVMLGKGLASGQLEPDQAVALTRWALTQPGPGAPPAPWGNPAAGVDDGKFLSANDFQLGAWLTAFRDA
jgi:hypothetical protein